MSEVIDAKVLGKLSKLLGRVVTTGNNIPPTEFISTGHIGFDYVLGGGLPVGKLIEIYGDTHVGKSTMALAIAKAAQSIGKNIFIVDGEDSITQGYLGRVGLDVNRVVHTNVTSLNTALKFYREVLADPECNCGVFIFDTVASLKTDSATEKLEDDAGAALMATEARVWSSNRAALQELAANTGTSVIFTNHQMTSLSPYAPAAPRGGGKTIPQICSVAIKLIGSNKKAADDLKSLSNVEQLGSVTIRVEKSRFKTFGYEVIVDLDKQNGGYVEVTSLIRLAKLYKLMTGGAWHTVNLPNGETERCHGLNGAIEFLQNNPNVQDYLKAEILREAHTNKSDVVSNIETIENSLEAE